MAADKQGSVLGGLTAGSLGEGARLGIHVPCVGLKPAFFAVFKWLNIPHSNNKG